MKYIFRLFPLLALGEFNYERELKSYAFTGTETELSCGNKWFNLFVNAVQLGNIVYMNFFGMYETTARELKPLWDEFIYIWTIKLYKFML